MCPLIRSSRIRSRPFFFLFSKVRSLFESQSHPLTLSSSASAMASSPMIFPLVPLSKALAPVNKAPASFQNRNLWTTRLMFPSHHIQAKLSGPVAAGKSSRGTEDKADPPRPSLQSLSTLPAVAPWDDSEGGVWVNMALYLFLLHIPLSVGGLSIAASLLRQPQFDPQTKVLSLLIAVSLELVAALALLRHTANPCFKFMSLFQGNVLKERNTLKPSVVGLGLLISFAILTSMIADYFDMGSKFMQPFKHAGDKKPNTEGDSIEWLNISVSMHNSLLLYCSFTRRNGLQGIPFDINCIINDMAVSSCDQFIVLHRSTFFR
ncbi:uncharacterized protein LOC116265463 isoform X2 [Nymphaea colorata]|uniref:uncharacterized protein LOC116265463 isoform X2 n=1 Tax=Nymphaea colorata TaxID=210225 RepID=UPI00129DA2AC|nr:uncharacterized protein LOC116265463 isoform X2 [Nymphaea colorata]